MNTRRLMATGVILALALTGGCGGDAASDTDADGSATSAVDSAAPAPTEPATTEPVVTGPPATQPPATEPPATEPPTTSGQGDGLPDWASGEIVTVGSDNGPLEMPVELARFCEASRSFYLAAQGLALIGADQAGTARQLFGGLAALSPRTIDTAPSEDFATEPMAARDQLAILVPAFDQIDYDSSRLQELADPQAVLDALADFGETRDALRMFLVEACGADEATLDEQARNITAAAAEAAGEASGPAEPVAAVAGSPIVNEDGTIDVSVPDEWTEVEASATDGTRQLLASSDIDALFSLSTPGAIMVRGVGGLRDGGFVGQILTTQGDLEEAGCELVDQFGYDEGMLSGQERVFDCGNPELDVRLLGGSTADESLYAFVLLVSPADQPGVRQLIVETLEIK